MSFIICLYLSSLGDNIITHEGEFVNSFLRNFFIKFHKGNIRGTVLPLAQQAPQTKEE
jgi:hypothetical protein